MFEFVKECGSLDLNSPYCYLLQCTHFADTCVLAEDRGRIEGFVSAYRPPSRADVLFVWQIGVHPRSRGNGVARKLLREVLSRPECADVRFLDASVTPSNLASRALFESIAREFHTDCDESLLFGENHFAPVRRDDEILLRIGPLKTSNQGS